MTKPQSLTGIKDECRCIDRDLVT